MTEENDRQEDPLDALSRYLAGGKDEGETVEETTWDEKGDSGQSDAVDLADTQPSRPRGQIPAYDADTRQPAADGPTETMPPGAVIPSQHIPQIKVDEHGMPLPQRVSETDMDATHVSPSAYSSSGPITGRQGNLGGNGRARRMGCVLRAGILGIFGVVLVAIALGSFVLLQYYRIAATLPSVDDLRTHASDFETTRILDRNGNLLYEILDPNAGRRTYVKLDEISPFMVAAVIATEDKDFYSHPGFSISAIVRAFWQNISSGETVSGASTITQQLARNLLFSPEEAGQRTYMRKVREAILAEEITRRYSKDEILELYLNEAYFGNLAYGVEAAAETYFGTTARQLTLGQAAFLAGLPQAPSVYDVYSNRDVTLGRYKTVLQLMYELSLQNNCIYVSNNREQPICVDLDSASVAAYALDDYVFKTPDIQMRYPHWVNYIRSLLEELYDPQTIYRSGFTVYTTLDPRLQDKAQEVVAKQIANLEGRNVQSGALIAIRPSNGEILAMVGSADYYNEEIDGQINMAVLPRQPGSSIKPLTYVAAFEQGWTPATLIWDVESEFPPSGNPDDPREPFIPVNYDERHHGPVTVRHALANSYNIPAVKALQFVGIYDNPNKNGEDGMVAFAHRVGISDLNADYYGLSLTLGGGEVKLLDMTSVFGMFGNGGRRVPPYAITSIKDHEGNVVYEHEESAGEQVVRAEHAFLISSILSDNEARSAAFGTNSVLRLPFSAAAKTGTTNDFRDNWTLGYTPDLAVGVWVGNPDFTQMENTTGLSGAAPIWAEFMQAAIQNLTGGNPTPFVKPAGIVDRVICAVSGTEPSRWCPDQRREYFAADQLPLPKEEDLWQDVFIDTWTGLKASPQCADFTKDEFAMNVQDPWAIEWIKGTNEGRVWAEEIGFKRPFFFVPDRECNKDDPRPILEFVSPSNRDVVTSSPLDIVVQADATAGFERVHLLWGRGNDPGRWEELDRRKTAVSAPTKIYSWDVSSLPAGTTISLRLHMVSVADTYAETTIRVTIQVPTPTALPSLTPTMTVTASPVPTLAPTTAVPTTTQTPTPSLTPSLTPTLPASPTPTDTPVP